MAKYTGKSVYTITWGKNFLRGIGAPYNAQTDMFLRAWAQAEGSAARNNPFATTQEMPGSTNFNSVGVQNYLTWQSGVEATVKTINNPDYGYEKFLAAIRAGVSARTMAFELSKSRWGTGALTTEILLNGGPRDFKIGNCYPVPPAPYAHGKAKIVRGSTGADVDELLRAISAKQGLGEWGYKYYSPGPIDFVKKYQLVRPWLWPADGIVGPSTYKSITGHA
jgi:hypothetical protein